MSPVDILIADDHELFRRTVRSFIESQPDYRVCGEACDGIDAIEKARQLSPHVVLMDINMPRMDGLEATRVIRRELPDCKVIIVTQNHATIAREQARTVDAMGAVTKADLTRDLFPAIKKVFGGLSPDIEHEAKDESKPSETWVRSAGALGQLVDKFDWAATPLGPKEGWSKSLKTVVRVLLTSRFAMWMSWGPELTFLYNDAYAKMTLGKKHPWALGKPSHKVWEEIWHDIGPRIRRVLDTGQATWDEALMLFLERSGYREETYHTFSYSPLADDDGEVAGHLCVVTEETDRVIGERRLKTLRSLSGELGKAITEDDIVTALSRGLSENDQDLPFTLIYFLSPDGAKARLACRTGIGADHPSAVETLDLSAKDQLWPTKDLLSGKDSVVVDDLVHRFEGLPSGAWDSPPARALLLPIMSPAQGTPAGILIAGLNPYRPLDVSYAGFLNLIAGQIAASVANARAYEQERKRAEALAEVDRAKTLFFSNVSHEFRTPLTLMLAPLEDMLAESRNLAPHQRERLDIAHRNSLRLLKLVNTLLDFSRIEAGRFQASYEPTDLSQFTSELASVFRSAVERAGLRLIIDCPKLDGPVYVDRELWEKIVFNLLSNAFKFTFEGEIEVSIQQRQGAAELAVRDTGTGIRAEDLQHLFARFYRVKNARGRTFEGSGIGLALVQELARQHGGSVQVESVFGQGSIFRVTIPFGNDHLPADRIGAARNLDTTALRGDTYVEEALHWLPEIQNSELKLLGTSFGSGQIPTTDRQARGKILLADDNADMREYLRSLLSSIYDVRALPDGEAALNALREDTPDLVLTDVMMPNLDGFGLLKAVRADERTATIPVILLSARAGEESRLEGLGAGADDYLVKPFSARELMARVRSQIAMSGIRRKAAELERELRQRAEAEHERLQELFMQSPAGIAFLSGPEHRFSFVNFEYVKSTGRKGPEAFAGKTVAEVFPELENDPFWQILDEVYRSGIAYTGTGVKVTLKRGTNGELEDVYYDVVYQPFRGASGGVEGILLHAVDVSERKRAERSARHNESELMRDMQHLSRIQEIRTRLLGSSDLQSRLSEILSAASDILHTDKGNIQLYDPLSERLRIVVHQGFGTNFLERFTHRGSPFVCDLAAKQVKRFIWGDIAEDPALKGTEDLDILLSDGIRAIQSTPLLSLDGRLLGLLNNHFRQPYKPSDRDFHYVDLLARMAGDLIERWQVDDALRESERKSRRLADNLEEHVKQRTVALEKAQDELRDLSAKLLMAQDEERRRIARELHDSAGQTLAILGLGIAQFAKTGNPELEMKVAALQEIVQQLTQEIRTTSYLLHPPLLDETGIAAALQWYVEGLVSRTNFRISLDIAQNLGRLSRELELVIFRVVQECMTNIIRHSESKDAHVSVTLTEQEVVVTVRDAGKGIPTEKLEEMQSRGAGVGIRGMRERVRQSGGTLRINSDRQGTTVSVTMPINQPEQA